jgi:ribonucleoside-diphosphate reductase alpha chain
MTKTKSNTKSGLEIKRYYTQEGVSVYDQFQYEYRSSVIKNPAGDTVFEMNNVEVPKQWSQVATDILAQKYFRRAGVPQKDGTLGSETSIKQVAHRLADCWTTWGNNHNYFATDKDATIFYEELVHSIINQSAAPNSPQWFNTGLHSSYGITGKPQGHYYVDPQDEVLKRSTSAYERPQPHACFILSVDDDLVNEGGIMDLWVREARIFKYGSGVGTNFSTIRGEGEKLSGGGTSSGLMSFLKIGDRAAGAIKSGGTTRRAAKMVCLDLDHPEIVEFIDWKVQEEKKVAALIAAGYSHDYEGEAYRTVSGQNSNNSIRIPNSFFKALENDEDWNLVGRGNGQTMKSIKASQLWDKIGFAAWACADPGTQYDTTINEWHTCPEGGRINASNPCSEYMFLDNTACNLASINLGKVFNADTQTFDVNGYEHLARIWTVVLEVSVLMAQFPSQEVAQLSYDYRTLGLGYANLGSVLMMMGLPYDSDKARNIGGALSAIMTGIAYKTSAEMAQHLGPFKRYAENKEHMLRVMRNHRNAAYDATENYDGLSIKPVGINAKYCPDYLLTASCKAWNEALQLGELYGYRNAQTTVIAPTGTIGLVMDCDTTGVEPDFALVKFKKLSGGGYFKIINQSVPAALKNLGYNETEVNAIVAYAKGHGNLSSCKAISHEALLSKGFSKNDIEKIEAGLPGAFDIAYGFNKYVLGEEAMRRLGFTAEQYNDKNFHLLEALGFTQTQIDDANEYVCGTMTTEGAPFLKAEHYSVFDTANKCGVKGTRFIQANGHIKMMGNVQPFISGAISKTINMPNEATIEEIKDCYKLSWELGLKANAIYRDGCKLSQPLSGKSEKKKEEKTIEATQIQLSELTVDELLGEMTKRMEVSEDTQLKHALARIVERKTLPSKRHGYTHKAKIDNQAVFVRTGEYNDGTIGELFIDMHKEGAAFRSMLNCFAIAVSVGLQYGVPLEEFVDKFTFTRFEPAGRVEHPNIKSATSVVDFIFRLLGHEYLNRVDLVHVPNTPVQQNELIEEMQHEGDFEAIVETSPKITKHLYSKVGVKPENLMPQKGDGPACTVCGHQTVRNSTCYKCLNCGATTGCV